MKQRFFVLVTALLTAVVAGAATGRNFKVGQFDALDCGGSATFIYTVDDKCSLRAEGEARAIDQYQVQLKGRTLVVRPKSGSDRRLGKVVFRITAPSLRAIDLGGATKFYAKTVQTSADFDLDVSGASGLDIKTLAVKGRLDMDVSGASKVLMPTVQCGRLDLDLSGSSNLQTTISTEGDADVDVSGACKVAATICNAGRVDVDLSGASKAELDVTADKVRVDNSGASSTRIKLDCKHLHAHNSGATKLVLEGTADKVELDQSGVSKYDTLRLNRF